MLGNMASIQDGANSAVLFQLVRHRLTFLLDSLSSSFPRTFSLQAEDHLARAGVAAANELAGRESGTNVEFEEIRAAVRCLTASIERAPSDVRARALLSNVLLQYTNNDVEAEHLLAQAVRFFWSYLGTGSWSCGLSSHTLIQPILSYNMPAPSTPVQMPCMASSTTKSTSTVPHRDWLPRKRWRNPL